MLEIFGLLFSWLPDSLEGIAIGIVCFFVLAFFVSIILKIIDIIRG